MRLILLALMACSAFLTNAASAGAQASARAIAATDGDGESPERGTDDANVPEPVRRWERVVGALVLGIGLGLPAWMTSAGRLMEGSCIRPVSYRPCTGYELGLGDAMLSSRPQIVGASLLTIGVLIGAIWPRSRTARMSGPALLAWSLVWPLGFVHAATEGIPVEPAAATTLFGVAFVFLPFGAIWDIVVAIQRRRGNRDFGQGVQVHATGVTVSF